MGAEIRPRLIADAAQKNELLLPLFGLDPEVYSFVYDDPVKRDEAVLADRTRADVAAGLLTINEARAERNLERLDDPAADVARVNGQTLESLDAAPQEAGGGMFDIPSMFRSAEPARVKHATAMIFKGMHDDELPEWRRCGCETKDDDDIAPDPLMREVFDDHLKPLESTFERVVREMQDEIIASERDRKPADLAPLIARAQTELREAMVDIVAMGVQNTLELAGQDVDGMFDVVNTRALDFLDRHTIRVAEDIAHTTETMIRPAIQRGLENGLSISEIADEMDGLPRYRAERIARTETQTAVQGARYETLGEVGVELVQWVNSPGVSAAHKEIASRVYYEGGKRGVQKYGQPFIKAGENIKGEKFSRDIYHPPARPNCACSTRGIFPED
jgi:hypothetical protein